MARIARVVGPGYPHHITQRGNRRQQNFFCDKDYLAYLEPIAEWWRKYRPDICRIASLKPGTQLDSSKSQVPHCFAKLSGIYKKSRFAVSGSSTTSFFLFFDSARDTCVLHSEKRPDYLKNGLRRW